MTAVQEAAKKNETSLKQVKRSPELRRVYSKRLETVRLFFFQKKKKTSQIISQKLYILHVIWCFVTMLYTKFIHL